MKTLMKPFEYIYLLAEPFLLTLHGEVRRRLKGIIKSFPGRPVLLDVGGRKSHYTTGLYADVTIMDRPRTSDVQKKLHLGINEKIIDKTLARRSNIKDIIYGDMTECSFESNSFDCVSAIEVLEHVERDDLFVREVNRVLKPGGVFLMTTPNGEHIVNTNPDHKRHYTREQLHNLISRYFTDVTVNYAVLDGYFYRIGLNSWSLRRPLQTFMSMLGNVINSIQSRKSNVKDMAKGTCHLIAVAVKER